MFFNDNLKKAVNLYILVVTKLFFCRRDENFKTSRAFFCLFISTSGLEMLLEMMVKMIGTGA